MRRFGAIALSVLFFAGILLPVMGGASMLTPDDLDALKPAFEQFILNVSVELVKKGLLEESDVPDWLAFQLADFMKNGGHGTIQIMYNPNLLDSATWDEFATRIEYRENGYILRVDTLRGFSSDTALPGLPLDIELYTEDGGLVNCVFNITSDYGSLSIWDSLDEIVRDLGGFAVSLGEWVFWNADIELDAECGIFIECESAETSDILCSAALRLICDGERWVVVSEDE
jgi:hypothetical protein